MIAFRVDANEQIATGHLMRCISIAEECMRRGEECLFFLAEEQETDRLRARGIPYQILHTDWNAMEEEIPVLFPFLEKYAPRWLIVDSYQATAAYLAHLNQRLPVLYLDDMAADLYPVSALLHYGSWPEETAYDMMYRDMPVRLLTGMSFAPLREEFRPVSVPPARQKSILITTGGTDPLHVTWNLVRRLISEGADIFRTAYTLEVICGSMNPDMDRLRQLTKQCPRIHLHQNISDISHYMRTCTAAVSAGGTTLFELCACQIPTICFSFADNQKEFTEQMGKHGIMLYAGDARDTDISIQIQTLLFSLLKDASARSRYASRMGRLVDGNGVRRIADFLSEA